MNSGTIKWFNSDKGFGFITNDNGGADIFIHLSAILSRGYNALVEGQRVAFEVEEDPKTAGKFRAAFVTVLT